MGQRSCLPAAIAGAALLMAFLVLSLGGCSNPAEASALKASPSPSSSPSPSAQPPAEPPPDWDAFLGTVATLSGAVSAILGGFVLAALLSISSDRNSMVELLKERERTLETLNRQLDAKRQERNISLRELLLAWVRAVYREDDDSPELSEVRRRIAGLHLGIEDSDLSRIADDYVRSRRTADAAIRSSLDDISAVGYPRSFNGWAARHSTEGIDLGLLKDAFDRAVDSIQRQERLADGLQRSQDNSPPGRSAREADSLTAAEADIRLWSYGPDAAGMNGLRDAISRAESMKAELSDKVATLRLPSHLGLGVAIFCFIAITGVIYPLCLMPSTTGSFTPAVDLFIKSCLGLQMVAIVGYIGFVARSLRAR